MRILPIHDAHRDAQVFIQESLHVFDHGIGYRPKYNEFADAFHHRRSNDADYNHSYKSADGTGDGERFATASEEANTDDPTERNKLNSGLASSVSRCTAARLPTKICHLFNRRLLRVRTSFMQ